MGRTNLYFERVKPRLNEIEVWSKAGANNREIAEALQVGYSNFSAYVNKYPELKKALEIGRMSRLPEVKEALLKRCLGFEYEEKKTYIKKDDEGRECKYTEITKKQALPDVSALAIFLRNYDPEFRDKDNLTNEFKRMELEMKKQLMEMQNF